MVNNGRVVIFGTSVLVVMDNIDTVNIIGTVFWWPWTTMAQWTSLAHCFGGHGQHWHSGHHWHSVLVVHGQDWHTGHHSHSVSVVMVNIGTVVIIGTVFWWSWTTLAQWTSWTQCFGGHRQYWQMDIIGTVFW